MSKVAIFAPKYPPDAGGAAVYFEQVVEELANTDWTPIVFAPVHDDCPRKQDLPNNGTLYRCFPHGLFPGVRFLRVCHRLLKAVDPDCLHVHPHFPQWRLYRWLTREYPTVYDCRDHTFTRRYVQNGDAYLSATHYIDDILTAELSIAEDQIHRSPVVVETPDEIPNVCVPGDAQSAVFVGDLTAAKGPLLAIEGVKQHRDWGHKCSITLFGDGPQRKQVAERASQHNWVHYHGVVDHETAIGSMQTADALVLPSETEAIPRVVMEALSVGTPVVATPVGLIPDVISDVSTLVRRDAESIAQGLLYTLDGGAVPSPAKNDRAQIRQALRDAYSMATS